MDNPDVNTYANTIEIHPTMEKDKELDHNGLLLKPII